jgi:hypothetical protein
MPGDAVPSGAGGEELFCGSIDDGSDQADYEMARDYLAECFTPLRLGAELARLRTSAQRLVTTPWAQKRIVQIAGALLQHGTLSGEQIFAEVMDETDPGLITAAEFNRWSGRAGGGR